MIKKKKAKRKGLTQEDTLRTFVTAQVQEIFPDMTTSEKVQTVETVSVLFGPALFATTRAAILAVTEEEEDDEVEDDEDEDEEYEDEDEDEE